MADPAAEVETRSEWDADRRIVTTWRTWRHDDGSQDDDVMERRVISIPEITALLEQAGFRDVQAVATYVTARRTDR
ncbi:hypothetical protein OG394_20350 [Kribbella sp. NBC_01245]|uniref:hypothetical protein n=1 Tax=Kribbella sp. NBC_01245 TaxID=2903578 RepID=UPI002E2AEE81|nr:hypothetical protein [Kribbella sp. NBC_01245]